MYCTSYGDHKQEAAKALRINAISIILLMPCCFVIKFIVYIIYEKDQNYWFLCHQRTH
jgi:hypothetical protein